MSLSGDITREEYVMKKNEFVMKETDIKEKLRSVSGGGDSWLEPALAVIYQANAIPNALESPDPAVRAELFKTVGLNRRLADRSVQDETGSPDSANTTLFTLGCCPGNNTQTIARRLKEYFDDNSHAPTRTGTLTKIVPPHTAPPDPHKEL